MEKPIKNFTDIAFTESVQKIQKAQGSYDHYKHMDGKELNLLTPAEKIFIESQNMFYMSTVGENGWPYVQFRGGPKGFLKVLSSSEIAFADFRGNRQYISTGNITATKKVTLILMDYTRKKRLKIWAETEIVPTTDKRLKDLLVDEEYGATIERFMIMTIKAYNWNCPQHITQRFTVEEYSGMLESGQVKLDSTFLKFLIAGEE